MNENYNDGDTGTRGRMNSFIHSRKEGASHHDLEFLHFDPLSLGGPELISRPRLPPPTVTDTDKADKVIRPRPGQLDTH